jgi:hypothetical protein
MRRPKRKARPMPDQVSGEIMSIMPAHVVDAMMLTAMFGFRKGEAFTLQRTQIDWDHEGVRLQAEDVKDDEDAFLPASQFAMGYLRCLDMDAEARGSAFLVTWQPKAGRPLGGDQEAARGLEARARLHAGRSMAAPGAGMICAAPSSARSRCTAAAWWRRPGAAFRFQHDPALHRSRRRDAPPGGRSHRRARAALPRIQSPHTGVPNGEFAPKQGRRKPM